MTFSYVKLAALKLSPELHLKGSRQRKEDLGEKGVCVEGMGFGCIIQRTALTTVLRQQLQPLRLKHKYPKQVRERIDVSQVPEVDWSLVEENLMRGSGPGGQSVATTSNAVQLVHRPTGVSVKCHESR